MTTFSSPLTSHPGANGLARPPWSRWWVPAVCAVATLPLIVVFGPEYGNLQRAADSDELRAIVRDAHWRYAVAAAIDVVFAASYGLAAFATSRRAGLARWAPSAIVLGAMCDEIENVFVLFNVLRAGSIGDMTVDIMRGFGTVKTWALLLGAFALVFSGVHLLWRRRDDPVIVPEETRRNGALTLWFAVFVLALAAFAAGVRIEAPMVALLALGVLCVYALGRLSAADRRATEGRPHGRMAAIFLLVALISGTVVAASLLADVPDEWGFAALGAALYALIRSIDHSRRRLWGSGRLRVGLLIAALAGFLVALPPVDWLRLVGAGVTVVAGAAAVELWSASFPPILARNRLAAGIVGAALLAVMTLLLLFRISDDPVITCGVVAAVFVATALLITSNDMPILLGVLLLAALWSGVPRNATLPDGQELRDGEPYFAVLGDSYISGEGTERYFEGTNTTSEKDGSQCRRSPDAWPMLLNPSRTYDNGDLLRVPKRVANFACSGAVAADIRQVGDSSDGRSAPEQLAALKEAVERLGPPSFVLVGISGNDAQFGDIGVACALPGECTDFLNNVQETRLRAVGDEVARTHAEIRIVVGPDVPVVAVPYPRPLHLGESDRDDGEAPDRRPGRGGKEPGEPGRGRGQNQSCRGVVLSEPDIRAINAFAAALNDQIERAAHAVGALYMDTMEGALADGAAQLCDPNERSGLNFADLNPKAGTLWAALDPRNWVHNFVHPNEEGHAALQGAALRWFAENGCVPEGSCGPVPISSEMRRLAQEDVDLPDDVTNDGAAAIAEVVPLAIVVLGALTVAWWLLITAFVRWGGVVDERPRSSIERIVHLTSPRDDPIDGRQENNRSGTGDPRQAAGDHDDPTAVP